MYGVYRLETLLEPTGFRPIGHDGLSKKRAGNFPGNPDILGVVDFASSHM